MSAVLAAMLATEAINKFRERAETEHPADWVERETYDRYVAVLRSGTAWMVSDRCVAVSVADTPDGRMWGYVAGETLDAAVADYGDATIGQIYEVSPTLYRYVW